MPYSAVTHLAVSAVCGAAAGALTVYLSGGWGGGTTTRPPRRRPRPIATPDASPAGGHYSQAVVANGQVAVSGLLPITPTGQQLAGESFEVQVKCVLRNLRAILVAAGTSEKKLVSCRVYVTDIARWGEFNRLYAEFLGNETKPARCVVPVPVLHYGLLLELEAVASL
jgi:2-iminobutanoate/2-iminopropanoate deaminase